jgi:hypothetical protein
MRNKRLPRERSADIQSGFELPEAGDRRNRAVPGLKCIEYGAAESIDH